MANYKISVRYAESLLETAKDKNNLDTVSKDMELVKDIIVSTARLKQMLQNPVFKPNVKAAVLSEIFRDKISKDSLDFLLFVLEKNREEYLEDIIKKFLELKDEYLGIVNVDVKASQQLDAEQAKMLTSKFEGLLNKKVRLSVQVDSSIIGGFIARVGDTVYDASVRHQLNILKKQFVETGV